MWALLACFQWTSQSQVDRFAGESCWDPIAERLQKGTADCFTSSTLGSADTIPLGTDLDPHNGYCNLWAAGKVHGCIGLTTVPANHRPTLPACSTSTHYHAPFSSSWLQSSDELSGKSPHNVWRNMPFRVTLHIQPGVPWGASRQARFFQHFGPFFDSTIPTCIRSPSENVRK